MPRHAAAGAAALRLARRPRVGAPARRRSSPPRRHRRPDDRRARPGELALARDPDRPELRMTAIAPPDIHDADDARRRAGAARRRRRPAADAARGARRRRAQRAVARQRVHQPARARGARSARRCAACSPPRSASAPPRATSARSTAGSRARKHIDEIEALCVELLKRLFKSNYAEHRLVASMIGNMAVYAALTEPGDTVMTIPQPVGGHSSQPPRRPGRHPRPEHRRRPVRPARARGRPRRVRARSRASAAPEARRARRLDDPLPAAGARDRGDRRASGAARSSSTAPTSSG